MMPSWSATLLVCCVCAHTCAVTSLGRAWFVSYRGSDDAACGESETTACRDLGAVLARVPDNATVSLEGGSAAPVYNVCRAASPTGSLHLVGYGGRPTIGCRPWGGGEAVTLRVQRRERQAHCFATVRGVAFLRAVMLVGDCDVRLVDTVLRDASVRATDGCAWLAVTLDGSVSYGRHACTEHGVCSKSPVNNLTCVNTAVRLVRSSFYQTSFDVTSYRRTRLIVSDTRFANLPTQTNYLGGIQAVFAAADASIRIENSTFENQMHPTRTQGVINLYEAAVWLKAVLVNGSNSTSQTDVVVTGCSFVNNERAITLIGPYRRLVVEHSVFRDNMAMHAGAAILVLVEKETTLNVENCTFTDNLAGHYRAHYPVREPDGVFRVVGNEVHLHANCCKGVIQMVGKGGAIRVQRGVVSLTNSRFRNNSARLLGGSVFVDIDGNLIVRNTRFANTDSHRHALQGDILYSDGHMTINEASFLVRTATSGLSVLRHSGDHWSLNITNVWVECPVGYNLRATNSSAYGVTAYGLRRSYKLDQLTYFCESCQRNKYSLDHGYLNYTMVFRSFAYFTLLINGSVPKPENTGQYIHHVIQCDNCPYGGRCVQGITAVSNFWGYIDGDAIKFQHCPKGYCLSDAQSSASSTSVSGCVKNRHGRLCGACKPGHSEALFSSTCVSDESCAPVWLWTFSLAIGFLYAMFLLFQTDLKNFLFSKRIVCASKKFPKRSSPEKVFSNGHIAYQSSMTKFIEADENCEKITSNNNAKVDDYTDGKFNTRDGGSGFVIILFYYFQDALLLHVKTVNVSEDSTTQKYVTAILSMLFKFQLDLFDFFESVCAAPGMTAVGNVMAKALLVPYVILIFIVMYVFTLFVRFFRPAIRQSESRYGRRRKSFTTRLASGFILALMFTFQKLGTSTFTLLNCVPVEGSSVLFIDGTVTCYQYWQHGVIVYAVVVVTPFFVVLLVGPPLLQAGRISLTQFFLASLCPLPMLLLWLVRSVRRAASNPAPRRPLSAAEQAVLNILQGPFKDNTYSVCWAGVLIGRRLVLVLLFTFVNDTLIRLLLMLFVCFVILLHHVHVQPYKGRRGNVAGTTSAAALVALGCINLVRAGFEAAEYVPSGPNATLMNVFGDIENSLLLWLPLAIMSAVSLLFLFRVAACVVKRLSRLYAGDVTRRDEHDMALAAKSRSEASCSFSAVR